MIQGLGIVFLVIILDFLTKFAVVNSSTVYHINTGGAFSLFRGQPWLLGGAVVVLLSVLTYVLINRDKIKNSPFLFFSFALFIGGSISNMLDRWLRGGVVDFIKIWLFPVFNVADLAITVGVVYILFVSLLYDRT